MTNTLRERLVLRAFHALRGSESTTLGGLRPVARATTQCWRGWTPRLHSVPCLLALRATAVALLPRGPAVLRTATPKDGGPGFASLSPNSLAKSRSAFGVCCASTFAFDVRFALIEFRLGETVFGVAVRSAAAPRRAASPPTPAGRLGGLCALGRTAVSGPLQPLAVGSAGCGWTPCPGSLRDRFPFRSRGSLQRHGSAPDAAGQLANARRWPSLPCRIRSSPPALRSCCAGLRAVARRVFRSSIF